MKKLILLLIILGLSGCVEISQNTEVNEPQELIQALREQGLTNQEIILLLNE